MNPIENLKAGGCLDERDRERIVVRRNRTARAICKLMADRPEWQGTASQLVEELKRLQPGDRRLAVQTAGGLGQKLNALRSVLSNAGLILIENERVGHGRTRMIYLTTIDPVACKVAGTSNASADSADSVGDESAKAERALNLAIAEAMR